MVCADALTGRSRKGSARSSEIEKRLARTRMLDEGRYRGKFALVAIDPIGKQSFSSIILTFIDGSLGFRVCPNELPYIEMQNTIFALDIRVCD